MRHRYVEYILTAFPTSVRNYCRGLRRNLAFPKHGFKLISRVSVFWREDLQMGLQSIRSTRAIKPGETIH